MTLTRLLAATAIPPGEAQPRHQVDMPKYPILNCVEQTNVSYVEDRVQHTPQLQYLEGPIELHGERLPDMITIDNRLSIGQIVIWAIIDRYFNKFNTKPQYEYCGLVFYL